MSIELNNCFYDTIKKRQSCIETNLSPNAFKTENAYRLYPSKEDIRPAFFHDSDRIIHSRCYSRYIDKTQVFYLIQNDHITHRVLHVQLVSKIARTIGRFLNLNEDLIEAIALGHDVGHTPFGHNGERIVSKFCEDRNCGKFEHNIQSFRLFHELENNGKGLNLTAQVLDGIICHNGEMITKEYVYNPDKTKEDLLNDYESSLKGITESKNMIPMTLEACVMRISDVIAYLGRDIEDAITLKLITREDIPSNIKSVIGNTNRDLVNNLIIDIINNSFDKNCISFSDEVFEAMNELKKWNYKNIYNNPKKQTQDGKIEFVFYSVMEKCFEDLIEKRKDTKIHNFIKEMDPTYFHNTPIGRIVSDYVSGMTDEFLLKEFNKIFVPQSFGAYFK